MIRRDADDGMTISAIARKLGRDRKTIRKHLRRAVAQPEAGDAREFLITPFQGYLAQRIEQYPQLPATRLLRELQERGYRGSYQTLTAHLRRVRPKPPARFEIRFETEPGHQAQADFAEFRVRFLSQPERLQRVWLFTIVLGHSRRLWGRFCTRQNLHTVLAMHVCAFEAFGGAPRQVLYDRMKTAVIGETDQGEVIYNSSLVSLLSHYGAIPRACRPYRPQTKGKIERQYRYIRNSFFAGSEFEDLDALNRQLQQWLDQVANVRCHGTTGRHVDAAFAEERPSLTPLPALPYNPVLCIERKVSRDGMICYEGNSYSVPDGIRTRIIELQVFPLQLRLFADGHEVARHPKADGRGVRVMDPSHRKVTPGATDATAAQPVAIQRPLEFYDAVGWRLSHGVRP